MTTIVWREWFNEAAVKQLTAMGTLPREEMDLDCDHLDGEDIAALIGEQCNKEHGSMFTDTTEIVILEPEKFAGTYRVHVEYEPSYSAYRQD